MAHIVAERNLAYACFDKNLDGLEETHQLLKENNVPLAAIYRCVLGRALENPHGTDLFDHLKLLVNKSSV